MCVDLHLVITDPETAIELGKRSAGEERHVFALAALRVGVLAIAQAQGRIDADAIRHETDRLVESLDTRLAQHSQEVGMRLAATLKEYFDPGSGRFTERVEQLIRQDGELEQLLRRQVGLGDSELARTLTAHVGDASPLLRLLEPSESGGFLGAISTALDEALATQRTAILREFSLDDETSALSRLVRQVRDGHRELTEDIEGTIAKIVGEFSLDDEGSALSRLVERVERAQRQISAELSLDSDDSALARIRRELLGVIESQREASTRFQEKVTAELAALTARREESRRSTTHGHDFEAAVVAEIEHESQLAGDLAMRAGSTAGLIRKCRVGDAVVTLGPDSAAGGAKIVVEAKENAAYTLPMALEELEVARRNRDAAVGLFVFSRRTAPEGLRPLARYGDDVVVVWDPEAPATDPLLAAALSVARALCVRTTRASAERTADLDAILSAIREVERQAAGLDEIARLTDTIRNNGDKILRRARVMKDGLAVQIETLDEAVASLQTALAGSEAP